MSTPACAACRPQLTAAQGPRVERRAILARTRCARCETSARAQSSLFWITPRRMLCTDCQSGYHAPYDRFERLAANPEAPSYLMRCKQCGALWNESSGVPELLTRTHARWLYPEARI